MITQANSEYGGSGNDLKKFQLTTDTKSKSSPEFGIKLAKYITSTAFGTSGYFFNRNARFRKNRDLANGTMNMQAFQDFLEFNGKVNYVNINWNSIKIVNRIISSLVSNWMTRNEKISVGAIDIVSRKEKDWQYQVAEFVLDNKELLQGLEQESGVPMIPKDQFIAEDKDELDSWAIEYNNLPEEILYKKGCNNVLESNGWFSVLKEKLLHDSASVGLVGTYTYMDEQGEIHVQWLRPENMIYSYSEYPDFRDTTWRGHIASIKISELRAKYGVEFGGDLTEEQLFKIAGTSKDYQLQDKLTWDLEWANAFLRPYDEWNVDITYFEVRTVDSDGYQMKVTGNGTLIIDKVNKKPDNLSENKKYVKKDKWNIYRGAYLKDNDILVEWGLKKNMIRPQDPKELGNAEFSYSFYMYQSNQMRNVAIPEKIEEPVEQMILTRLKVQQLVAKMKPTGAAINVDALQELDLGLAEMTKPIEIKKIYDQTGDLYYRGRDAEGNQISVPVTELANNGFMGQLEGLIAIYNFHYQVLKDELGLDPNLQSQAVQPRVTSQNVQASIAQANNATEYIYDAYSYVMEDTARKVACLLNDSVTSGAKAYRDLLKQDSVRGRIFATKVKMQPTQDELMKLEAMMTAAIQTNQDFVLYCDPFKIMRVAKDDVKLGELYFRQAQKRYLKDKAQQAAQASQQNAQIQIESAKSKSEGDMQLKQMEAMLKDQSISIQSKEKQKEILLTGLMDLMKSGQAIPSALAPLADQMFKSVGIEVFSQTQEQVKTLQEQEMAEQERVQQQEIQEQQPENLQTV